MGTPNLADLRDFLDITDPVLDSELQIYLESASGTIAQRCGPLTPESFTEHVDANRGAIVVSHWPIVSLTAVTDNLGNTVDVAGARVDHDSGVIRLRRSVDGPAIVEYTSGYNPCPADLELAVYVVASHLWDTQRGRSGSFAQIHGLDDDAPVGGDASYFVMQGFALPRRAMELTRPYIKAGFR